MQKVPFIYYIFKKNCDKHCFYKLGTVLLTLLFDFMFRDGSKWFARPIREIKDESWKYEILTEVTDSVKNNRPPTLLIPTDEEFKTCSKKVPKPPVEEVVKRTKSRF